MNRLGWSILLLFVLAGAGFALMLQPGSGPAPNARPNALVDRPPVAPPANASGLVIPVAGIPAAALVDTWGQSRAGGLREHHAIDIMAPRGTPVVAARGGRVEKLFDSAAGGRTVYIRSADGGYVDYYAHLDAYRDGLAEGQLVRQGQAIATVGSTGNASPDGPHLHFEVKRMGAGDKWYAGEPLNPYPLLAEPPAGG